ncbi:polysaccharide pyruvyl transferase family protein [Curtobacterium albidum]|uniref:polysaccharide pyruvyl transferase family protein n=1 Tax=Curtobacterium citreum TaxID=2036 RepID=UPI002025D81B|nr:polysaccharide pyruvyl transferase family protein [Curtobacterium albidum]MCL9664413.1 polysaccharide pyruvyl transferase family protein [Curtobacterium albidum]
MSDVVEGIGRSVPRTMDQLRQETRSVFASLLGTHREVALLDFPNHQNVGDAMIWRGELDHLGAIGVRVRYSSDVQRFSPTLLEKLVPEGPILLHGGGNFGDLWPQFQIFREQVVQRFPKRKIVQLPQSIEFRDEAAAARANQIFAQHPDFHLLVRDRRSYARARALLPDVQTSFCHDAALGWQPSTTSARGQGTLVLARRDHERGTGILPAVRAALGPQDVVADWGLRGLASVLWKVSRMPLGLARKFPGLGSSRSYYVLMRLAYAALNRLNLHDGQRLFNARTLIATDRLHAHVLALLLGKPHVVADNSYGKIAGVIEASTKDLGEFLFVNDENDAAAWLEARKSTPEQAERGRG